MLSLSFSRKFIATAALAFAACGIASSAHARTDVTFSIGVQVPGAAVYGAPVYGPQRPVYVQPRPVYVQPYPVYVQPQPVYVRPRPVFVQQAPIYVVPQPVVIRPRMNGHHAGYGRGWNRGQWAPPAYGYYEQRGHGGQRRGDRD